MQIINGITRTTGIVAYSFEVFLSSKHSFGALYFSTGQENLRFPKSDPESISSPLTQTTLDVSSVAGPDGEGNETFVRSPEILSERR